MRLVFSWFGSKKHGWLKVTFRCKVTVLVSVRVLSKSTEGTSLGVTWSKKGQGLGMV